MSAINWLYKSTNDSKVELKIDMSMLASKSEFDCTALKSFEVVGSYNWCPESTLDKPVLIIPGESSCLKEKLKTQQQLKKISYLRTSDENKSHFPTYPIEPVYRF